MLKCNWKLQLCILCFWLKNQVFKWPQSASFLQHQGCGHFLSLEWPSFQIFPLSVRHVRIHAFLWKGFCFLVIPMFFHVERRSRACYCIIEFFAVVINCCSTLTHPGLARDNWHLSRSPRTTNLVALGWSNDMAFLRHKIPVILIQQPQAACYPCKCPGRIQDRMKTLAVQRNFRVFVYL